MATAASKQPSATRWVIEAFTDGNIGVTEQQLQSNRRVTGDKRKQLLPPAQWQRHDRWIVRPGKPVPAALAGCFEPLGSYPEVTEQARANAALAAYHVNQAHAQVAAIEQQLATVQPSRKLRVQVLIDYTTDDGAQHTDAVELDREEAEKILPSIY